MEAKLRYVTVYVSFHDLGDHVYVKASLRQHFRIGKRDVATRTRSGTYYPVKEVEPFFYVRIIEEAHRLVRECHQRLRDGLGDAAPIPPTNKWEIVMNMGDMESPLIEYLEHGCPSLCRIGKI